MKKTSSSLAIALACGLSMVAAATPSLADSYGNKSAASDTQEMGEHHMDGTLTKVNHRTGFVTVKTEEGSMHLHYPPKSIKELKNGDKIRVYLGYSELTKKM